MTQGSCAALLYFRGLWLDLGSVSKIWGKRSQRETKGPLHLFSRGALIHGIGRTLPLRQWRLGLGLIWPLTRYNSRKWMGGSCKATFCWSQINSTWMISPTWLHFSDVNSWCMERKVVGHSRSWRLIVLPVNWESSDPLFSSVLTVVSCEKKRGKCWLVWIKS